MKRKRPPRVIAQLAMVLLIAGSMPGLAFELDERLLGISKVPYKVGQTRR